MSSARVFVIWVSAQDPAVDHAVTDEEMGARNAECRGDYRAVCGAVFLPASDDQPPHPTCPACAAILRRRAITPSLQRHRHRRRGPGPKHRWTSRECAR